MIGLRKMKTIRNDIEVNKAKMNICIITGSSGLIGSESVAFFADKFDKIIGIDNNMRQVFLEPMLQLNGIRKSSSKRLPILNTMLLIFET